MSSRAYKKLQKQQEEQKIQDQLKKDLEEEEEEELEIVQKKPQKNFFMMGNDESEDEEEEEENKSDNEEEEKRKKQEEEEELQKQQQQQKGKKGNKKSKKNKKQQKEEEQLEEDEDFDKMLEQLNLENQKEIEKSKKQQEEKGEEEFKEDEIAFTQGNLTLLSPLQIITAKLNYDKELQKYFKNAKFIEETGNGGNDDEEYAGIKDKRLIKKLKAQARKPVSSKQFKLVYGLKSYRPVPERFQTKIFNPQNGYGQKEFAFFPTVQYEKLQDTYEGLKNTLDPQNLFDFAQRNPYHTDTMYDIGEYFRLQGNFKQANQILSQILYVYEDSFGPEFKQIYDDIDNKFCLSYDKTIYSKTLFMALLKFIDILGKKGCFRSALEYNKFLLKLNPYEDPVGSLLSLDYNALSSKQYSYLEYFVKVFGKQLYKNSKFSILYMPNMIYSVSLAKFSNTKDHLFIDMDELMDFKKEDFDKAIDFTRKDPENLHEDANQNVTILIAILLYPRLIAEISEKNEFHKQQCFHSQLKGKWQKKGFRDMFEHPFFLENRDNMPFFGFLGLENDQDIAGVNKIFDIYVERSKIVYKNNQIVTWLKAAVGFILQEIEEREFDYESFVAELCEKPEFNIIPFKFSRYIQIHKSNFSDHVDRLDLNNIEQEEFANMQNQMQQQQQQQIHGDNPLPQNAGFLQSLFQSFLPGVHLPQQDGSNNNGQNNNNVIYQDDDVEIQDEGEDDGWQDYNNNNEDQD